jgi:hypothetical protein
MYLIHAIKDYKHISFCGFTNYDLLFSFDGFLALLKVHNGRLGPKLGTPD